MHDPRAKVIVSRGCSNDPILSDYRAQGFMDVLPPYGLVTVSEQLRKALALTSVEEARLGSKWGFPVWQQC